jgi:peptidoglycan/xylan/chitin deacetylase (PgdA/CDA1 family)
MRASCWLIAGSALCALCVQPPANAASEAAPSCNGVVYLTLDTGNMRDAERIAQILRKHEVKATFFLANERTPRGDHALDPAWAGYWKARAAEGHAFGTHTWRHGRILGDEPNGAVRYRPQFGDEAGRTTRLTAAQWCGELQRVGVAFESMTGQALDPLWRAPGGHVSRNALEGAQSCGFAHVAWASAGFLGDELPSDKYPNDHLLARALRDVRDGDILMAHLGIWSRADPFAPMLDPLIAGLRKRGLCLRTLREHPQFAAPPNVVRQMPATRSAPFSAS